MIAGYVTYDELKLITGFPDRLLSGILSEGVRLHAITIGESYTKTLYNLKEVEDWIRVHIY